MGKRYYIILGFLAVLFIVINASTPTAVNWKPSFKKKDKNPYGAEVTYAFLEDIFGKGNIKYSNASPYEYLHKDSAEYNLIYLASVVKTTKTDMDAMLGFAQKGNNIFIAAQNFSGDLADSLGLWDSNNHMIPFNSEDSVTLSFTNETLEKKEYSFKHDHVMNYIEIDTSDDKEMIVLSESSDYQPHFVKVPYGKGNIFYHCNPLIFTNFNILHKSNQHQYISTCLSYLPKKKTIWSEFFSTGGSQESETDLRFILKNPQLRWAWYILISFVSVFLLFQSKRRQRAIPVVIPPKNSTLEFVETTGRLYFQQRNHSNLANKKIIFFLEKVRTKFYINTSVLDEIFIEALASKSGVPQEEIRGLIKAFDSIKKTQHISETELLELNKKIESFYTKASL